MNKSEAENVMNALIRLEYSQIQGCFHEDEPTEVHLHIKEDDFSFLGIMKQKESDEFTNTVWKISDERLKEISTKEMELLIGYYFTGGKEVLKEACKTILDIKTKLKKENIH